MTAPIIVDTGGLLPALARTRDGISSFPDYEAVLTSASIVIVPGRSRLPLPHAAIIFARLRIYALAPSGRRRCPTVHDRFCVTGVQPDQGVIRFLAAHFV